MNYPQQPPPQKKGMSPLAIVLIVVCVFAGLGLVTCGVAGYWASKKLEDVKESIGDGGMIMIAPPEVSAALAGDKKNYIGAWQSKSGKSSLLITPAGQLSYSKAETTTKENISGAAIAAFEGNDIVVKMIVTLRIKVTTPPHETGGKWEMVADGITFVR